MTAKPRLKVDETARREAELARCRELFDTPQPPSVYGLHRAEPVYPDAPGFTGPHGTSQEAAETVDAATWRDAVLEALRHADGSADQVAARLQASILTIRPRLSELHAQGRITDTGRRATNASGKQAVVWTATRSTHAEEV